MAVIDRVEKILTYIGRASLGLGLIGVASNYSTYSVDVGQRAVVFDRVRGVLDTTVGEGTHFLIPWLQKPYIIDIRTRPHTFSSVSGTRDLQRVNLTLRVVSRPDVAQLPYIFQSLGPDFFETVLPSISIEVLEAVVGQFTAEELVTERPKVLAMVRENLIKRAKDFNLVLEDVSITGLAYRAEISLALEAKLVAQQEANRSKWLVDKTEQETKTKVIRAEGEKESANMIGAAILAAGAGLVQIRRLEAYTEVATTLLKSPNVAFLAPREPRGPLCEN